MLAALMFGLCCAASARDSVWELMIAAEKNSVDVARLLIEAGADVNAKSNNGLTALWYARNYYKKNVRELLEAAGAR